MDKGSQTELTLKRLPSGGYVVRDAYGRDGAFSEERFACTTIDEALKFMRDAINPVERPSPTNPPPLQSENPWDPEHRIG